MEIYVAKFPVGKTRSQIEDFLRGKLKHSKITEENSFINIYRRDPSVNQYSARIQVLSKEDGDGFVAKYYFDGPTSKNPHHCTWGRASTVNFQTSNRPFTELLRLALEEHRKKRRAITPSPTASPPVPDTPHLGKPEFDSSALMCGLWDYCDTELIFQNHYEVRTQSKLFFGEQKVIIVLGEQKGERERKRLDISYIDCYNIVLSEGLEVGISFTLKSPPKLFLVPRIDGNEDHLRTAFREMNVDYEACKGETQRSKKDAKIRLDGLDKEHVKVVSECLVYRVSLSRTRLVHIKTLLDKVHANLFSTVINRPTGVQLPFESLVNDQKDLDRELKDKDRFGQEDFKLRFQLQRLASNSVLPPYEVLSILPKVRQVLRQHGLNATLSAIRRFYDQVPLAGPGAEASERSLPELEKLLEIFATDYDKSNCLYERATRCKDLVLIHKVIVTPTTIRLTGPELEPLNEVLRKHANHINHFLRAVFQDEGEDEGSVRSNARIDASVIYNHRFKNKLHSGINIAGQQFVFLAVSHSSLRSQSCWLRSPWEDTDAEEIDAAVLLREFGDCDQIKSPAKCTARIGQNFTDTIATVKLDPSMIGILPGVERYGYDFTDGCGTISEELLRDVWKLYGKHRSMKPVALQIRIQGAKGMVSLDTRLEGKKLMLRDSMIKYPSNAPPILGVCSAAFEPIPMVLNQQYIKILEDLGVKPQIFLDLQEAEVARLKGLVTSPLATAAFLDESSHMRTTSLPLLITSFAEIGLNYRHDGFVQNIVEMSIFSKLRDLKYRARIPVKNAVTLLGIADFTEVLKEGQIYVVTESSPRGGRKAWVQDCALIARSPALHPGDMQFGEAVDVDQSSPLWHLRNVIVFSVHGTRPLADMLAGGDYDGDGYSVIFDERIFPVKTHEAAEYPKPMMIELDHPVTSEDRANFFVEFMENDQMGYICNVHKQLADQDPRGTLSDGCLVLARLASIAVDYSKTGVRADTSNMPDHDRDCRPEHMRPSPRVVRSDEGLLGLADDEESTNDIAFENLENSDTTFRYYPSPKVLGQLFSKIDEEQFLAHMHGYHHNATTVPRIELGYHVMAQFLIYMKQRASAYGILYAHHFELARNIRSEYESFLINLLHYHVTNIREPLTEVEAFTGEILGQHSGPKFRSQRERNHAVREDFQWMMQNTRLRITKGDETMELDDESEYDRNREFEGFPRAIACLAVAIEEQGQKDQYLGEIESFKYIAAAVCLDELRRFRATTWGLTGPLPEFGSNAA